MRKSAFTTRVSAPKSLRLGRNPAVGANVRYWVGSGPSAVRAQIAMSRLFVHSKSAHFYAFLGEIVFINRYTSTV